MKMASSRHTFFFQISKFWSGYVRIKYDKSKSVVFDEIIRVNEIEQNRWDQTWIRRLSNEIDVIWALETPSNEENFSKSSSKRRSSRVAYFQKL